MQVNKLRISTDGPVPAGRYFAAIAENLRAQNLRAATDVTRAEAQERRVETRYRRTRSTTASTVAFEQAPL
ncbi:MAG: hypothetical protein QM759_11675 [Terricaulis sp.]